MSLLPLPLGALVWPTPSNTSVKALGLLKLSAFPLRLRASAGEDRSLPELQHRRFVQQPTLGEAFERERVGVNHLGMALSNQIGNDPSRGRGVHHAMSAEPVRQKQSRQTLYRPDHRKMIRRHLIQSGPCPLRVNF